MLYVYCEFLHLEVLHKRMKIDTDYFKHTVIGNKFTEHYDLLINNGLYNLWNISINNTIILPHCVNKSFD